MKYNILFIFCFLVNILFSQNELFIEANEHYSSSNYEDAISLYDSILSSGSESKEIYYNLGNSHYKSQEIGLAILNFEKALKFATNDKDIKHNLQFCNKLILDKGVDLKTSPINELLFLNDSPNRYGKVAIFIFVLLFLALMFFTLKPFDKKILYGTIVLLSTAAVIFSFLGYKQNQFLSAEKYAIIVSSTSNIKSEPLEKTNTAFVLHEGSKVEILIQKEEWTKVLFDSDKIGWINNKHIKTI